MHNNFIIHRRRNKILYTEFFIIALIVGFSSYRYYKVQPALAFLFGLLSMGLFSSLFFANRIFRYLFAITFSLIWAFLGLALWEAFVKDSGPTPWIFMVIVFLISIEAHYDHFDFLKSAKIHEYEIY